VTLVDAMSGFLNQKDLMDASGFHLNSDEAKLAYLNKFADAFDKLTPLQQLAVSNKVAVTGTSDPVVLAKAIDEVAGTTLAAATTPGGLAQASGEDAFLDSQAQAQADQSPRTMRTLYLTRSI